MSSDLELLTTTEAAFVADVSVRDVNRLIDEDILPGQLYSTTDGRRVSASACALLNFYVSAAELLTASERSNAIRSLWNESKAERAVWTIRTWRQAKPKWTVQHRFLTINFDRFVADTLERHHKLIEAQKIVVEDADILGGTPVIKGTRVPVYDVAASVAAGLSTERIKEAYPSLTDNQIELATLYAKATPPRGRPRQSEPAPITAARKTVRRRKA